ncbi:hypothetical protein ACUN9Y_08530 [Halomonas sp. V046]|uniref:hypothetical protein n=1 Tax=Halomonas sp. V046 TaxID=3459611 RepID=UPI0040444685
MNTNTTLPSMDKMLPSMDKMLDPLREGSLLTLEFSQKLLEARFKTFDIALNTGMAQARAWCEVCDAESFHAAGESQQKTLSTMSERLKEEGETLLALSKEYNEKCQTLAKDAFGPDKE